MLNKFAEELKTARIKNDITLQQIANKTRIDIKFLEALENGNFNFLPELYIKAFIREYSKIVGLDDELMLKKFGAAKKGVAYNESEEAGEDIKKIKPQEEETKHRREQAYTAPQYEYNQPGNERNSASELKAKKQRMMIAGGAVAVIAVFLIIYFAFIKSGSEIIVSEKPYDEIRKENKKRYAAEAPQPQPTDTTYVAAPDSLLLNIETTDTSWVKILLDDSVSEEFTLFPYSQKNIKAKRNYKIIVGNSGAVRLKLNNKPLNFAGNKREVKYISIDSTGLQYLNSPPNIK